MICLFISFLYLSFFERRYFSLSFLTTLQEKNLNGKISFLPVLSFSAHIPAKQCLYGDTFLSNRQAVPEMKQFSPEKPANQRNALCVLPMNNFLHEDCRRGLN